MKVLADEVVFSMEARFDVQLIHPSFKPFFHFSLTVSKYSLHLLQHGVVLSHASNDVFLPVYFRQHFFSLQGNYISIFKEQGH